MQEASSESLRCLLERLAPLEELFSGLVKEESMQVRGRERAERAARAVHSEVDFFSPLGSIDEKLFSHFSFLSLASSLLRRVPFAAPSQRLSELVPSPSVTKAREGRRG